MKLNNYIVSLLAVLLSFSNVNAQQDVVAKLTVDTTKILIGEPVQVVLQVSQPKSVSINWPLFVDSMGKMEILEIFPIDTVPVEDANVLLRSQTFSITSFDSGVYIIPEVYFDYALGGDKTLSTYTDAISIEVFTVPVDTSLAIKDIQPIMPAPTDLTWLLWAIIGYHVLLLLMWFVIWKLNKSRLKEPEEVKAPVILIPAHVTALDALKVLEAEKLWQDGKMKLYFTRLTDIVRIYIEERWMVGAQELTTDEILNHGFLRLIDPFNKEDLEKILRLSDLVKFAKWQAIASECELSMQLAVKFVNDTSARQIKMEAERGGEA
jgi:hypothetical protein